MADIKFRTYHDKMSQVARATVGDALRLAEKSGHQNITIYHWLYYIVSEQESDVSQTILKSGLDRGRILTELHNRINEFPANVSSTPVIDQQLALIAREAWTQTSLAFGELRIRTGHVLVAILHDDVFSDTILNAIPSLRELTSEAVFNNAAAHWQDSLEEREVASGGSLEPVAGASASPSSLAPPDTPLARFARDLTALALDGGMDPIVGRDHEVRQVIDVLMRRRQNNPILTGEAGVGKTAVAEAFAQRLAANDVPPALQGMRLFELDIGQMQAGASMKGEFEQRLRSLIDQVQSSPIPIILFIDEAHTLIGAGGAQGTGDAANLLKPALARGTLRTIGATTWSEYRQYFEKDPALSRRFQAVAVDEPDLDRCAYMLRGIMPAMEAHHGVRISDEAVLAAVQLSARYMPSRQLPDKAVSLLDTSCARVAVSLSTVPARIEDLKAAIAACDVEIAAKDAQRALGESDDQRRAEVEAEREKLQAELDDAQRIYDAEREAVDRVLALRAKLDAQEGASDGDAQDPDVEADAPEAPSGETETDATPAETEEDIHDRIATLVGEIEQAKPEDRMVYSHVDAQSVASVISDWTGIPAGRMVTDELDAVLRLPEHLAERVIGQDHGLEAISKRIQTNRAGLSDPDKPIGVFMLCGPSGVGKTETALAIAEHLYGGEQNMIAINMSEFQEAHSVSLLKGAPPGYVGYGEGGRLTEAVRRKPYSVVLLDEIEKAHSDIHELFFQVFDKGIMEDGNGRPIDFKNTVILLTSNVGTETVMDLGSKVQSPEDIETLGEALKPALMEVFPPALLGRIVTIPYLPLGQDVLEGICRLKLNKVVRRLRSAHRSELTYSEDVVQHIVDQCRDPDSGGRMIDNIITNSILPDLSRELLGRFTDGHPPEAVKIELSDGALTYTFA